MSECGVWLVAGWKHIHSDGFGCRSVQTSVYEEVENLVLSAVNNWNDDDGSLPASGTMYTFP
jgi:hypothetical protein